MFPPESYSRHATRSSLARLAGDVKSNSPTCMRMTSAPSDSRELATFTRRCVIDKTPVDMCKWLNMSNSNQISSSPLHELAAHSLARPRVGCARSERVYAIRNALVTLSWHARAQICPCVLSCSWLARALLFDSSRTDAQASHSPDAELAKLQVRASSI